MALQQKLARMVLACGMACAIGMVIGAGVGALPGTARVAFAQAAEEGSTEDVLVFKNGTRVTGTIVSETATAIKFKSSAGGIAFETEYQKSEIIEIKRATKKADAGATATPSQPAVDAVANLPATNAASVASDPNAPKIYIIPLNGVFGEDISETPLRDAMRDATAQKADIVVLSINARAVINPNTGQNMDSQIAWDLTSRVEQIFPVFTEQMPKEWRAAGVTPPRVAVLVNRAMGAAAFFPFAFKEVYFSSNGRMGGVGGLGEMFNGRGDDVVREKQRSLRLGHVAGWANFGGYNTDIVRAMARREHVLTMKLVGGKAQLFERMPEDPSEELLTDDGEGNNRDTVIDYFEGVGDDVLTLNPRTAMLLGISKATVDSEDDLIVALAAGRNAVVIKDRGDRIMKQWSKGLSNAQTQILKLIREFQQVQIEAPGDYNARTKYRGIRKQKLVQVKSLLSRWGEALGIWVQLEGMPGIPQLETFIKDIELQQMADRPEPK